ncbi:MAG: hypothetical protein RRC34_15915 [Lentisphaeria bacterium]|nr:hypothetical protein [Lentisphaeria bacterium]
MKDKALEAVWKSRKSIAQKCGFDSHRLVKFIQQRGKDKQAERAGALDAPTSRQ